jgi:hypothetical protein
MVNWQPKNYPYILIINVGYRRQKMKWLEFIRVQASGLPQKTVISRLLALKKDLENSPGLSAADVYTHASVNCDFVISLLWYTDQPQSTGSRMGLNLSEALKKYGLVDHSVWIGRE